MFGIRGRACSLGVTLTVFLALCVGSEYGPFASGKDNSTKGPAASAENREEPGRAKSKNNSRKKARPEKSRTKAKGSSDDAGANSGNPQAGQPGGSYVPVIPGATGTNSTTGTGSGNAASSNQSRGTSGAPRFQQPADNQPMSDEAAKKEREAAAARAPNPAIVQRVIDVQNRMTPGVLSQKGVVATCTGLDEDGNVVIKVYTTGADDPKVPKSVEGVAVLEVVTGHGNLLAGPINPASRLPRPFPIGVSAASVAEYCGSAPPGGGTIGCRLKDSEGRVFALGCCHVFGNTGLGVIGDQCIQPGSDDEVPLASCDPADVFGTLFKFAPITLVDITDPNAPFTKIDAAVVLTTKAMLDKSTPPVPDGYGTPRTQLETRPFLGMRVQKYGKETGLTTGTVTGLNVNQLQIIDGNSPATLGFARFRNNIEITGDKVVFFALPGDSGSLVVTMDRFPVGMVFSQIGGLIYANPIKDVLDFFRMTIDGDDANDAFPPGKEGRATPNSP